MKRNKLANTLSVLSLLIGVGVAIPFGGGIAMTSIALGLLSCVSSQMFLSEPRKRLTKKEKLAKEFMKVETSEKNEEPAKIYEKLNSMGNKAIFKGNHIIHHEQEIRNEDEFDNNLSM